MVDRESNHMAGPENYRHQISVESSGDGRESRETFIPMDEHGVELAREHVVLSAVEPRPPNYEEKRPLTAFLDAYRQRIEKAVDYFRRVDERELAVSYSAEWILDNNYVIYQTLREISQNMPRPYYNELPHLAEGQLMGYPRVYAIARHLIQLENGHINMDLVQRFIEAYQSETPLKMGEIWALPTMLRLGIIQTLTFALVRITQQNARSILEELPLIDFLNSASDDETVANSIISLRTLATWDWKEFFESVSLVELILNRDPSGLYPRMDFSTRDYYRKMVEELADGSRASEQNVAREAVRLAQEHLDQNYDQSFRPSTGRRLGEEAAYFSGNGFWKGQRQLPRSAHVGYFLIDRGREELAKTLGYQPGWYKRLGIWLRSHPTPVYLVILWGFALVLVGFLIAYTFRTGDSILWSGIAALLSIIPALAVATNLVNWAITRSVHPSFLPKLNFEKGIPDEFSTVVVIPALLTSAVEVTSLVNQLELHHLRNPDANLYFALLTDFSDSPQKHMPDDERLLEQAVEGIESLNRQYHREKAPPFYLFHRERHWNEREGLWMGWERKRGKLHELNRVLLGDEQTTYKTIIGDRDALRKISYVITLDTDTVLPRESAARLTATLAHPLNRAEFDDKTGRVVAGYTILQPRTEISPVSANQSLFTRIFAGDTGLDLYTLAVSDVYQDFFGEGSFIGKGIYDVIAFERSLKGRAPENALLSHDLFEGIHGRAGLVTDVILIEDYPSNYLVFSNRAHRWMRGDWQILPWLFPRVPAEDGKTVPNQLKAIDRWKIFDNLRRSLLGPSLMLLLVAGWLVLPGNPIFWTVAVLLVYGVPLATSLLDQLPDLFRQDEGPVNAGGIMNSARNQFLRWFLGVTFLPYETVLTLNAIYISLVRVYITHRNLLQWTTAAQANRQIGGQPEPKRFWWQMLPGLLLTIVIGFSVWIFNPPALPAATPLLLVWLFSPQLAYWISRPIRRPEPSIGNEEQQELRKLARQTWLFFEEHVGPADHWLPPDHFQEWPLGIIAHRTSPTNIGLYLMANQAAYDFGFLGPLDLITRLRTTLENMEKLERYRGHFINWYDTRTLEPLLPRYVSTVDSGNLAAGLLILGESSRKMLDEPVQRWATWQSLLDTISLLDDVYASLEDTKAKNEVQALRRQLEKVSLKIKAAEHSPQAWPMLVQALTERHWKAVEEKSIAVLEAGKGVMGVEALQRLRLYDQRIRHRLENASRELTVLLPWLLSLDPAPRLFSEYSANTELRLAWQEMFDSLPISPHLRHIPELAEKGQTRLRSFMDLLGKSDAPPELLDEARNWCQKLMEDLGSASMSAKALIIGYQELSRRANELVQSMDFRFLYNEQRQIFHIGFNVSEGMLDNNFYDLLSSEARVASFIAIAKGDVPQSHWLHLGRPITQVDGTRALLSWSATMFEYLMPILFFRSYEGTLLDQSHKAVIERQIEYGRQKKVPWGISESGYYRFDANQYYQYRAFGVPGLGYKRGLGDDLVVTPYASFLALPYRPEAVIENLQALTDLGMRGAFGLYEAIDFTPARLPIGVSHAIVRSFMAHHQGMILISLLNYLQDCSMVERFHTHPIVQSTELLLQEQIPTDAPLEEPHKDGERVTRPNRPRVVNNPWRVPVRSPLPRVHYLSNGRYSVLVTNSGGGYSTWKGIDLTRWRPDTTLHNWGSWIYVQDLDSANYWSVTHQPSGVRPQNRDVFFNAHMADFRRRDQDISVSMEVTVHPSEDMEVRLVTLTNHSGRLRRIRLVSYGEVVLGSQPTDQRHPAFNKLFIESEYLPEFHAQMFRRRPRSSKENEVFMAHAVVPEPGLRPGNTFQGSRFHFLGRGRTPRNPLALLPGADIQKTGVMGATLDPVFSLGQTVDLLPHGTHQIGFLTLAASSEAEVLSLLRRFQAFHLLPRAFDQARSLSEVNMRLLGVTTEQLEHIQLLLSALFYPHSVFRASPETLAENTLGQPGLWAYGISGDYPILLVRVKQEDHLSLMSEVLLAHAYWRRRGLKIDLVIMNEQEAGYAADLNNRLMRLIRRGEGDAWMNQRGGIFLLHQNDMPQADLILLLTAARVILDADEGSLSEQVRRVGSLPQRLPIFTPYPSEKRVISESPPVERPVDLLFDNGFGGASPDGKEYVIYLEEGRWTPSPWINVIANEDFGCMATEAGLGFSWAINSGENRLTTWSNDPITDPPAEVVYLRDEETAELWTPTPLPTRDLGPYLVRHGAGYTEYEHNSRGLKQHLRVFASPEDPVKFVQLTLENLWGHTRRITATYYAEWVLGVNRDDTQQYIIPEFESESQALLARNPHNVEFGNRVAFATASRVLHGLTADRSEFLGRMGSLAKPAALTRIGLSGTVHAGLDPCAALQVHLDILPGETKQVTFLLGQGANREEALDLVRKYKDPSAMDDAWRGVGEFWDSILETVQVETPDKAMDLLLNRWLLYQALSCRIWGRSALYQSSGAYGFRDQLQDVMTILFTAPEIAREHILRAARHQFEAGDVLHWWHPPSGRGVRTHISDDLLWLPFVTHHYWSVTGDDSILKEKAPFLRAAPLLPEEEERYGHFAQTEETYTLYEHCLRAIERGNTFGPHNLPLIGAGDWNDGMNRVGVEGCGESIWLGWFLIETLKRFSEICDWMGDDETAAVFWQRIETYQAALEESGWDGEWYRRAYYDDGFPLGSQQNKECKIDSLAQSWAVLSGGGDPDRLVQAMDSVSEWLVQPENRLILLFTPPFDKTSHDPGYIKGYLPGIRENGGQYTHAAIWTVWAYANLGLGDYAHQLFSILNPFYHADTLQKASRYMVEPYVVAADIYGVPPHTGRGGWTWYTGSSGWLYRLGMEALLGLRRSPEGLVIDPCIPKGWSSYEIRCRYGNTTYHIHVDNQAGVNRGVQQVKLDGKQLPVSVIPFLEDGEEHQVSVVLGDG